MPPRHSPSRWRMHAAMTTKYVFMRTTADEWPEAEYYSHTHTQTHTYAHTWWILNKTHAAHEGEGDLPLGWFRVCKADNNGCEWKKARHQSSSSPLKCHSESFDHLESSIMHVHLHVRKNKWQAFFFFFTEPNLCRVHFPLSEWELNILVTRGAGLSIGHGFSRMTFCCYTSLRSKCQTTPMWYLVPKVTWGRVTVL